MSSPWFKFSCRYVKSPLFGTKDHDKIYIWMARNASQTEHVILNGDREVILRPGQFLTGRHRAGEELGLTENEWRGRVKKFKKHHLIDAIGTSRYTLITLIDPDTYKWQDGIYSRKGTIRSPRKEPTNNQQITTTIDDKDDQEKNNKYARTPPIEGEEEDELSEEESARFEASFSPTKIFVLSVWKTERGKYGLRSIKSPRNYRTADSIAAMIDAGDWTRDDLVEATRRFMSNDWARINLTMANLYEDFEKWLNHSEAAHDNRSPKTIFTRPDERKTRTPDYSTTQAGEAV